MSNHDFIALAYRVLIQEKPHSLTDALATLAKECGVSLDVRGRPARVEVVPAAIVHDLPPLDDTLNV